MTKMFKAAALAGAAMLSTAAAAQVATVDLAGAVAQSAAMKTAVQQIQTTYKAQIDAFNARQQALQTQLAPQANEIRTLQANPATPRATLQAKVTAFQTAQTNANAELTRLAAPFGRPNDYAQEQVAEKVEAAVRAAMTAKNVTLIVKPEAVTLATPAADLTQDVVAQLNNLVKTVSITPPAGWQPGQRAAAPAAAAASPAAKNPASR